MDMIEQLILEAERDIDIFEKEANDKNGSPDTPARQNGGGDIIATAQELLQQIEQFKASLQPQQQPPVENGGNVVADTQSAQSTSTNSPITIIRPDGTQIKLASLSKVAALRGVR